MLTKVSIKYTRTSKAQGRDTTQRWPVPPVHAAGRPQDKAVLCKQHLMHAAGARPRSQAQSNPHPHRLGVDVKRATAASQQSL